MWVGLINWTYTLDEFGWPILVGECLWKPVGPMSFGFSGVVAPVLKCNVNGLGCKTQHCRPGVLYGHCRAGYLRSARKICHFTTFTSRWFSPRVEKKPTWFDSTKKHQLVQLLQFQIFCCYSDWMNPCSLGFSAVQQRFLPGPVMWAMPLAMSWRNASQRRRLQRDHVAWDGNSGSNPTSMRQHPWYNIY